MDRFTDRQMTAGVILFGLLLYLPLAGTYGLFDPWETHYAEVARQMTVRHDYISLWWPGAPLDADHFWSKPVLSFWLMSAVHEPVRGAGSAPGDIALAPGGMGGAGAVLPVRRAGLWAVFLCLSRFVSRRAGCWRRWSWDVAAVRLVARQAMTDMAFVGPMTMALALGALALFDDQDDELPRRHWRASAAGAGRITRSTTVAVGVFVVAALPQLIVNVASSAGHSRSAAHAGHLRAGW